MMLYFWLSVCIGTVLLELLTPTALISIWFAVGALITMLVSLSGVALWVQIVCFITVSVISLVVIRPIATKYLRGNTVATNADRCIGEIGIVTKEISEDEWGEVKVTGALWHAIAVDNEVIAAHDKVKVVAIEGAKLLVKRVN